MHNTNLAIVISKSSFKSGSANNVPTEILRGYIFCFCKRQILMYAFCQARSSFSEPDWTPLMEFCQSLSQPLHLSWCFSAPPHIQKLKPALSFGNASCGARACTGQRHRHTWRRPPADTWRRCKTAFSRLLCETWPLRPHGMRCMKWWMIVLDSKVLISTFNLLERVKTWSQLITGSHTSHNWMFIWHI